MQILEIADSLIKSIDPNQRESLSRLLEKAFLLNLASAADPPAPIGTLPVFKIGLFKETSLPNSKYKSVQLVGLDGILTGHVDSRKDMVSFDELPNDFDRLVSLMNETVRKRGFALKICPERFRIIPLNEEKEVMTKEEFHKLPLETRRRLGESLFELSRILQQYKIWFDLKKDGVKELGQEQQTMILSGRGVSGYWLTWHAHIIETADSLMRIYQISRRLVNVPTLLRSLRDMIVRHNMWAVRLSYGLSSPQGYKILSTELLRRADVHALYLEYGIIPVYIVADYICKKLFETRSKERTEPLESPELMEQAETLARRADKLAIESAHNDSFRDTLNGAFQALPFYLAAVRLADGAVAQCRRHGMKPPKEWIMDRRVFEEKRTAAKETLTYFGQIFLDGPFWCLEKNDYEQEEFSHSMEVAVQDYAANNPFFPTIVEEAWYDFLSEGRPEEIYKSIKTSGQRIPAEMSKVKVRKIKKEIVQELQGRLSLEYRDRILYSEAVDLFKKSEYGTEEWTLKNDWSSLLLCVNGDSIIQ